MKNLSEKEMRAIRGGEMEVEPGPRPFNPFDWGICFVNGYPTEGICRVTADCALQYPGQQVACHDPNAR